MLRLVDLSEEQYRAEFIAMNPFRIAKKYKKTRAYVVNFARKRGVLDWWQNIHPDGFERAPRVGTGNLKRGEIKATSDVASIRMFGTTLRRVLEINGGRSSAIGTRVSKYRSAKSFAKQRRIDWRISFGEWWSLWEEDGKWDNQQEYLLMRIDLNQGYVLGNVELRKKDYGWLRGKSKKGSGQASGGKIITNVL